MRAITMTACTALACVAGACSASAAPLTEAEVKAVFNEGLYKGCTITWTSIQIAAARPASIGEIAHVGMPPHAITTPVRVAYTQVCHPGFTRDYRWNYYFFKDDFGKWTKQSNAMPGNFESEPR